LCGRTVCVGALEEVPVAKILVADDNSNIQKMVVLALKDQGIEVVAVGNGEAAVRKIADMKPDLVLADIFMPVRNGYEVCKFVKDDSALSHIPVILLVGAFDPLDEQEAQRVGADGVLKKPFVPPDPLISMVKAALARAGVALGTPASTPPPPMPVAAKPQPPPVARIAPPAPAPLPEREDDLQTPVFSVPRSSPLTIATSAQPLAFGSLLETATPEDEAVFAIPAKHTAPDRDWGSSAGTEEEEEPQESSKTGSWRISSAIEETASETPAGQTDWREAAFSGIGSGQTQNAGWAPSIEKNSLAITEEEAADLARKRDGLPAITNAPVLQDWSKAIEAVLPTIPQPLKEAPLVTESLAPDASEPFLAPFAAVPPPAPSVSEVAPVAPIAPPEAGRNVDSWMAGAINSPWDAESQHASQLAATWEIAKGPSAAVVEETLATETVLSAGLHSATDEAVVENPVVEEAVTSPEKPAAPELPHVSAIEDLPAIETLLSRETKEILQEETAQVVAEQQPEPLESTYSGMVNVSEPAPAVAPNMDEIVAKVLAKMNPEVLQAVTREILKPLVEAMVKDELTKK
jgi:CheY-like chemotaxis protein